MRARFVNEVNFERGDPRDTLGVKSYTSFDETKPGFFYKWYNIGEFIDVEDNDKTIYILNKINVPSSGFPDPSFLALLYAERFNKLYHEDLKKFPDIHWDALMTLYFQSGSYQWGDFEDLEWPFSSHFKSEINSSRGENFNPLHYFYKNPEEKIDITSDLSFEKDFERGGFMKRNTPGYRKPVVKLSFLGKI